MDVRQYLASKGYRWRERETAADGSMAVMNCPFCQDKEQKFAISLTHGAYNCLHLNNCGAKGSWWEFQKHLGDAPLRLDGDTMLRHRPRVEYSRPSPNGHHSPDREVSRFLAERKITPETIKHFKLAAKDGKILLLPYFKDGVLVQIKYRDVLTKAMWCEKDAEPVLFNRDECKGDTLLITEGELDTVALHEYGLVAVSVPSGVSDLRWIEHEWEWLAKFREIYLAFDYDAAGQDAVAEVARRLGAWRCKTVIFPCKDANDCLIAGIDGDTMLSCIVAAQEHQPLLLVRVEQIADKVRKVMLDDSSLYGTSTGWDGLNRLIKGWRPGELTVWTGYNGAGKSTMLNQVVLQLGGLGVRSCVASLEMPPERLMRWMVIQASPSGAVLETMDATLTKLNAHVFLVNTDRETSSAELLNVFEYAARRWNVKHFIIDSLMRVTFKTTEELTEHKAFCSALCTFARTHGAHMHLVVHPRKGQSDTERPDKMDVAGTGNITNLAHNVLVLWRADPEMKEKGKVSDNILFVRKNREWGYLGKVKFAYNDLRRRYEEEMT